MKKLTKIFAIILTLILLCACTNEVKQTSTSSVGSDASVTSSSQEISSVGSDALVAPSSEPTSSDSIEKTAQIVDEKYVRRAVEILSTKDLSLYYPRRKNEYDSLAYYINFLDMTDDETPELIVNMSFMERESTFEPPYTKSLIIDMDTTEVLTEFWGNCTGTDCNYFKKLDNKFVFLSANSIFSTINTRYFVTEFKNINGKLKSSVKYVICQERDYNRSNYFRYYFYDDLTGEEAEELYFTFNPEDFKDNSFVPIKEYNQYIHSMMSAEDVEMINIGFYYMGFDEKDGEVTIFSEIKEPYKYIESELKYPLS